MTYGIVYPFALAGGKVAMTSDSIALAVDRVTLCLGTQVQERVMRPTWGIDIMKFVHEIEADLDTAVREAIAAAFRQWFPEYRLKRVLLGRRNPELPTVVEVTVEFALSSDSPFDAVAKVGVQVPDGSEIYSNERIF